MNKRLFIVFLLGFSSGLPLALVTTTLQAWYSVSGMSVLATGMLSLVGLPYLYRIIWGPLLDRYALSSLGRRRSWMLLTQIVLLIGFNGIAWFNPLNSPYLLAFFAIVLACFSATQDVAVDAQRTEYLTIKEQGLGASFAVFGYRIGLLVAGGMALVLAHCVGWAITYRLMGGLMCIGVFATLASEEPVTPKYETLSLFHSFVDPIKELGARPYFVGLILFILFYKLGEAFTATTSGIVMPFLINGLGFSLDTIGYVNKILGMSAILLGGLFAGFILMRWALYRALLCFGIMQASTNLLFVLLAMTGKNLTLLAIAVTCDNFAAGMGSTALVVLFMRLVNKQFTATQFSLLVAVSSIPRVCSGPIAAFVQMKIGWVGLYELSFIVALGFIPFLLWIRQPLIEMNEEDWLNENIQNTERAGELPHPN